MISMVHHNKNNRTARDKTSTRITGKDKIIKNYKVTECQLEKGAIEVHNKI